MAEASYQEDAVNRKSNPDSRDERFIGVQRFLAFNQKELGDRLKPFTLPLPIFLNPYALRRFQQRTLVDITDGAEELPAVLRNLLCKVRKEVNLSLART